MIAKRTKTILFASLIAAMLPFVSLHIADATSNENTDGSIQDITTAELNQKIDELNTSIEQKQIENRLLAALPETDTNNQRISANTQEIAKLSEKLEAIAPATPSAFISDAMREKMDDAQARLIGSDLPIYAIGITSETGKLNIKVDSTRTQNIDQRIQEFVGNDIPLEIEYGVNEFSFQASNCASSSGPCNPIIGGSHGEDEDNGLTCTVSIAVVRNNWPFGTENGIIIPNHCNPDTSDYYQADNDVEAERVGSETKDGGWYCDCDFIKSDSRSIDTGSIYQGTSTDYSLSGNADIADETWIWMYGTSSGKDYGQIKEVNQSWQDPITENWFTDLYKIAYISYTDGDSGAPVIDYGNTKYGGMNIGTDGTYNLAHDWTFL